MKDVHLQRLHTLSLNLLSISTSMQTVRDVGINLSQLGIPAGKELTKAQEEIDEIVKFCYKDLRNLYEEVEND